MLTKQKEKARYENPIDFIPGNTDIVSHSDASRHK